MDENFYWCWPSSNFSVDHSKSVAAAYHSMSVATTEHSKSVTAANHSNYAAAADNSYSVATATSCADNSWDTTRVATWRPTVAISTIDMKYPPAPDHMQSKGTQALKQNTIVHSKSQKEKKSSKAKQPLQQPSKGKQVDFVWSFITTTSWIRRRSML